MSANTLGDKIVLRGGCRDKIGHRNEYSQTGNLETSLSRLTIPVTDQSYQRLRFHVEVILLVTRLTCEISRKIEILYSTKVAAGHCCPNLRIK